MCILETIQVTDTEHEVGQATTGNENEKLRNVPQLHLTSQMKMSRSEFRQMSGMLESQCNENILIICSAVSMRTVGQTELSRRRTGLIMTIMMTVMAAMPQIRYLLINNHASEERWVMRPTRAMSK